MSQRPISLSPDLKRLRDDGYDIEIVSGYLLMRDVPYVDATRTVRRGILLCPLTLAGEVTIPPPDHVMSFTGDFPCDKDGQPLSRIAHPSPQSSDIGEGIVIRTQFSSRPAEGYPSYYEKMATYASILSSQARAIDSAVTAKTNNPVRETDPESPFKYTDNASSRAETVAASRKLSGGKVAIIGLGGTGSYVLDFVAKTPVAEIHLFDGDDFLQHNAFRAPGAPSLEDLQEKPLKVEWFKRIYSKMHSGIAAHPFRVDEDNVAQLAEFEFVFVCMDEPAAKRVIVDFLSAHDIPFVDVGMGLQMSDEDSIFGTVRVTTVVPGRVDHVDKCIPLNEVLINNDYARNIQIADLNALNATLAVIKWKKIKGFYVDQDEELHSSYTLGGNRLHNRFSPYE